jgi:hypothetical protein
LPQVEQPRIASALSQSSLGHRDLKTTVIYADYQASDQERELVQRAFSSAATKSEDFPDAAP